MKKTVLAIIAAVICGACASSDPCRSGDVVLGGYFPVDHSHEPLTGTFSKCESGKTVVELRQGQDTSDTLYPVIGRGEHLDTLCEFRDTRQVALSVVSASGQVVRSWSLGSGKFVPVDPNTVTCEPWP